MSVNKHLAELIVVADLISEYRILSLKLSEAIEQDRPDQIQTLDKEISASMEQLLRIEPSSQSQLVELGKFLLDYVVADAEVGSTALNAKTRLLQLLETGLVASSLDQASSEAPTKARSSNEKLGQLVR